MLIIPVIDILDKRVVHAICGQRKEYRPVQSILTHEHTPQSILAAYCDLYPFNVIYIADLNAIEADGNNAKSIIDMAIKKPECCFWLDAGTSNIDQYMAIKNIVPVIGTETSLNLKRYHDLLTQYPDCILSLDLFASGLIQNHYLLKNAQLWPNHVIIMMLHRVGSKLGVDRSLLKKMISFNLGSNIYVAGGIANTTDIAYLKNIGVQGVLLASSLHSGSIKKDDLYQIEHK